MCFLKLEKLAEVESTNMCSGWRLHILMANQDVEVLPQLGMRSKIGLGQVWRSNLLGISRFVTYDISSLKLMSSRVCAY